MITLLLPLAALAELIKRPIFWALYPLAYALRKRIRERLTFWPYRFLWLALDSTIWRENMLVYNKDVEFCWYGKRSAFVEKYLPYDFARSFYWGAWRNNGINFMTLTEGWVGAKISAVRKWESGKSFYEVRTFAHGAALPYLEFWPKPGFRVQCGWITCGRFQLQARTYP